MVKLGFIFMPFSNPIYHFRGKSYRISNTRFARNQNAGYGGNRCTLISLINVKSRLLILKNSTLHKIVFLLNYRKNNCLNHSLAVEATCFTKHLSYLNIKGEAYSCNIPTSMLFDFATFAPPPTLARTKLLCMKNAGTQWTMNFS